MCEVGAGIAHSTVLSHIPWFCYPEGRAQLHPQASCCHCISHAGPILKKSVRKQFTKLHERFTKKQNVHIQRTESSQNTQTTTHSSQRVHKQFPNLLFTLILSFSGWPKRWGRRTIHRINKSLGSGASTVAVAVAGRTGEVRAGEDFES